MTIYNKTSRGIVAPFYGVMAGIASAVILEVALSHANSIYVLLAYLAAVPLFMVGLGVGAGSCMIASIVGTAALFLEAPNSFGYFYMMVDAIPAMILMYLAMRYRVAIDSKVTWSSETNLVAVFTLYPCLFFLAVYGATVGTDGGLLAMTQKALEGLSDQINALLTQNGEKITPEMTIQVEKYLDMFARITPALGMCAWIFSTIITLGIAQIMLYREGWLLRTPLSLNALHVPSWVIFAVALTGIVAGFAPQPYGYVAVNLTIVLVVPFFFVGLAVIHAYAATLRFPTLFLIVFYTVISVIVYLVLLVALVGVIDQWVDFRKRIANKAES